MDLASFLRFHSTTETLNLTVYKFQRGEVGGGEGGGGSYARDKSTSARLSAKNAGGGGGLCVRGGGVFAGHYGTNLTNAINSQNYNANHAITYLS